MSAAGIIATAGKESAMMMNEEIGSAAGAIWRALAGSGGCALPKLRKSVDCQAPVFDWAIGWLARENKIAITREKRSFVVQLKEMDS